MRFASVIYKFGELPGSRKKSGRPAGGLGPGVVEWSGVPTDGPPWRARRVPCEGSWGFERWVPGLTLREVVEIYPPSAGNNAGAVDFSVAVRLGDEVARTPSGQRRVDVGVVQISPSSR